MPFVDVARLILSPVLALPVGWLDSLKALLNPNCPISQPEQLNNEYHAHSKGGHEACGGCVTKGVGKGDDFLEHQ